jgi:hypothetical protein
LEKLHATACIKNKWNDIPEKGNIEGLYFGYRSEIKNKFRTIRPNSFLLTRFLTFLLHQIWRHISSSEFNKKVWCIEFQSQSHYNERNFEKQVTAEEGVGGNESLANMNLQGDFQSLNSQPAYWFLSFYFPRQL